MFRCNPCRLFSTMYSSLKLDVNEPLTEPNGLTYVLPVGDSGVNRPLTELNILTCFFPMRNSGANEPPTELNHLNLWFFSVRDSGVENKRTK